MEAPLGARTPTATTANTHVALRARFGTGTESSDGLKSGADEGET